ncbi:MAG: hypothetical protein ACOYB0_01525 [Polynucleobacter sp.]
MNPNIIFVKSFNSNRDINDFFKELNKCQNITQDFLCTRLNETSIKDILQNYISKNGISSLFHFSIACDAVLHPGFQVDDIEKVILGFIERLNGVKNLLIIDPYFYSTETACVNLFGKMISKISDRLETITFITNGQTISQKTAMHEVCRALIPKIKIRDVLTNEFHDRFWIDPENKNGIVIGTSLNGIGKKIALIDYISSNDAKEIAELAYPLQRLSPWE